MTYDHSKDIPEQYDVEALFDYVTGLDMADRRAQAGYVNELGRATIDACFRDYLDKHNRAVVNFGAIIYGIITDPRLTDYYTPSSSDVHQRREECIAEYVTSSLEDLHVTEVVDVGLVAVTRMELEAPQLSETVVEAARCRRGIERIGSAQTNDLKLGAALMRHIYMEVQAINNNGVSLD